MTDEEMNAKLQEINNKHLQKLSENWDIQQPVQFSLRELNLLRSAIVNEYDRYFKAFHQEDVDMHALMCKIDKIMEDIESRIRDGQIPATNGEIKIGSSVKLLYWKDNEIHDFIITDIFFEAYTSGYKTIVKAKRYSEKSDCWFTENYFLNDFFKAMADATMIIESEADNGADNKDT